MVQKNTTEYLVRQLIVMVAVMVIVTQFFYPVMFFFCLFCYTECANDFHIFWGKGNNTSAIRPYGDGVKEVGNKLVISSLISDFVCASIDCLYPPLALPTNHVNELNL